MKLLWLTLCMLVLCSGMVFGLSKLDIWAETQRVQPAHQIKIITRAEAKFVMRYHGIKHMEWSVAHHDFVFKRDGEICRARAFEIIKEKM